MEIARHFCAEQIRSRRRGPVRTAIASDAAACAGARADGSRRSCARWRRKIRGWTELARQIDAFQSAFRADSTTARRGKSSHWKECGCSNLLRGAIDGARSRAISLGNVKLRSNCFAGGGTKNGSLRRGERDFGARGLGDQSLKLGRLEFHVLMDGHFGWMAARCSASSPSRMWEKKMPADERNRIQLAMNCLLVRAGGKAHSGGNRRRRQMGRKAARHLCLGRSALAGAGCAIRRASPTKSTSSSTRICTSTIAAGNTRVEKERLSRFSERAICGAERRIRARQEPERARPRQLPTRKFHARSRRRGNGPLLEGDRADRPGSRIDSRAGTHRGHAVREAYGRRQTAFFFADLVPTTAHLALPWIMGYDLYPVTTLENKKKWIPEIAKKAGWRFSPMIRTCRRRICVSATAIRSRTGDDCLARRTKGENGEEELTRKRSGRKQIRIGIIGGSGLYSMAGLDGTRESAREDSIRRSI